MPINVRVGSEFDGKSAARVKAEAIEYYKRIAAEYEVKAKADIASAKKAAKDAKTAFNRQLALEETKELRVGAILNRGMASKIQAELNREMKSVRSSVTVETRVDRDSFTRGMRALSGISAKSGAQAGASFGQAFMKVMSDIGTALPGGLRGTGGLLLFTELAAVVTELGGVAASAAQGMWLIPAAVGAAGAAIGTLAMATHGFSDAITDMGDPKKFAEDLQMLSPNAQQAALSIQALMPAFTELKNATQDSFFAGFGQQITQLSTAYLPAIRNMTTGIAGAFNQMLTGVSGQLMKPETMAAMQTTLDNITRAFQNLAPAAAPFTKALVDIAAVGSSFLPKIAQWLAEAAQNFANFVNVHKQNGDLQRWLKEGLETVKLLGTGAMELAKAFMELAPVGRAVLPDIVKMLASIKDIIPVIGAAAVLIGPNFAMWEVGIKQASGAVEVLQAAFNFLKPAIQSVGSFIVSHMNLAARAINGLLEPLRAVINIVKTLTGIDIPNIPQLRTDLSFDVNSIGAGDPTLAGGAGAGAQMQRRGGAGGASTSVPDPFAGLFSLGPTGAIGRGYGAGNDAQNSAGGWTAPNPFASASSAGGGGGGSGGGGGGGGGAAPAAFQVSPEAAMQAINFAAAQQGKPYGASAGPTYYDCSGFMSDIFAVMTGKPYQGSERYFTTEANFPSLGFEPGYKAGDFNIGVNSGRAGSSQPHMAGTLPNGVNVEAGGGNGGVQYGGPAKGARNFSQMYHLPVSNAFNSAYGGMGADGSGGLGAAPPGGSGIPVYVTNMPGGGGGFGGGGGGAGGSGGSGYSDPLSAFFGGMAGGGGPLGPIGTLGGNIMGQLTGGGSGGGGGGGGLTGGGLLGMLMNGGMGGSGQPGATGSGQPGVTGLGQPLGPGAGGPGMPTNASPFDPSGIGSTPPQVQGQAPGEGGWQPKGGGFQGIGGLPMMAIKGAASASPIPGVGAGMDLAMELANKAAAFGGQAAAIGAQGLMETFLPHGSTLGDPSQNWVGKIASGFAGARPASSGGAGKLEIPGKQPDPNKVDPNSKEHGKGQGQPPGPLIGTMNYTGPADNGTKVAADIGRQTSSYGAGMPW